MSDRSWGFIVYPTGEFLTYETDEGSGDHTIPDDFDINDKFLVGRVRLVRKRSWWRLGRKVWRMVSVEEADDE